ncbi:MAG: ABC transporter ATP-binding protein [Dehalococcoidia bacterium]
MKIAAAPGAAATVAPMQPAAIEVRDLVYRYGERRALDGLSLAVPAGSIFGLLGPNGSGKSTLLSIVIGRRIAESGEVTVLGERLSNRQRARIGMVFQEPSLDPQMTVGETMDLQARMFGLGRGVAEAQTRALLDRVSLADRAGAFTSTLSGGMKRRLEVARALLSGPELVLLDEPTLALDPDSRLRLWEHLLEANAEGRTMLLATNDVYEAERYCGTVALLDEGKLVAQGRPEDLKRELRHESVRIEWAGDPAEEIAMMEAWPGVGHVRLAGQTTHVTVDEASPFLARLFQQTEDRVRSVRIEATTLEDVYFQLVGRGIASRAEGGEKP